MRVLGIDPGSTGALAQYSDDGDLIVFDMPFVEVQAGKSKKGTKKIINIPQLCDIFNVSLCGADHAYIEQVSAMPDQGVTSTFNFGKAAGVVEMGVAMVGVPYTMVVPVRWKMEMGLTNDKAKSLLRANQLFPKHSHYFARVKDNGRAEAAILAWYGYKKLVNQKLELPK